MKTRTLRQSVTLHADPHKVYEVLMDTKKHAKLTKSRATITRRIGGAFSAFDGGIRGITIALIPDKKIVQQWRCNLPGWPKNHFSQLTLSFTKKRNRTQLRLLQTGVPARCYNDVTCGWKEYYWLAMKRLLKG